MLVVRNEGSKSSKFEAYDTFSRVSEGYKILKNHLPLPPISFQFLKSLGSIRNALLKSGIQGFKRHSTYSRA